MFTETVSFPAAFAAGLLSFFAPCILPLIPAYFTFITGFSLEELTDAPRARIRAKVVLSTCAYVSGFSLVFVMLGASASYLGGFLQAHSGAVQIGGGIMILILGIHLTGVLRIPGLDVERRIHVSRKPLHFLGTFLVGMAFGVGWSPCIGPMLGSILIMAGSRESVWQGITLLAVYSAGLAVPFLVMSVFIHYMLGWLQRAARALRYVNIAAGTLLIWMGAAMIYDQVTL